MYLIFLTVPTPSMLIKMIVKRLSTIIIITATIQCHWSLAAAKLKKDNRLENISATAPECMIWKYRLPANRTIIINQYAVLYQPSRLC